MKEETARESVGKTCLLHGKIPCRLIDVKQDYAIFDFPEDRWYFTNGKLQYMPHRRVYFNTRNPVHHITNYSVHPNQDYVFKLKKFVQGVLIVKPEHVEPHVLLTIEESRKSKPPAIRRDKATIERDKIFGKRR